MRLPVSFAPVGGPLTFCSDVDGLMATAVVTSFKDDEPCLLTALFRMPHAAATDACRRGDYPVSEFDIVTVKRLIDEVVGRSGERYSRFEVSVTRA